MGINFDVYSKARPDFRGLMKQFEGMEFVRTRDYNDNHYPSFIQIVDDFIWYPVGRDAGVDERVIIDACRKPSRFYYSGFSWPQLLPRDLSEKLVDDNYSLVADEELYRIMLRHDLETLELTEFDHVFGISEFNRGRPTYHTNIFVRTGAPEPVVDSALNLALLIGHEYDGILWTRERGWEEPLDPHELAIKNQDKHATVPVLAETA